MSSSKSDGADSTILQTLLKWHFQNFSGAPKKEYSQNRYAEWLEKIDGALYSKSWWIKASKGSLGKLNKIPDLTKLAQSLSGGSSLDDVKTAHCVWELHHAFAKLPLPSEARYNADLDGDRCRLRENFGIRVEASGATEISSKAVLDSAPALAGTTPAAASLPGLDKLIQVAAEKLLADASNLGSALADISLHQFAEGSKKRTPADAAEAEGLIDAFSAHRRDEKSPHALHLLDRVLDKLTLPPDQKQRARTISALHAIFQLCLIRFAVRQLPDGMSKRKGISEIVADTVPAVASIHEACWGGQLLFDSIPRADLSGQVKARHYVELSADVTVPGQAFSQHLSELAVELDKANEEANRRDRLGKTALKGRVLAVLDDQAASDIHWRAVLPTSPSEFDAKWNHASDLFKQLGLPCIVMRLESTQSLNPHLRADGDYLEQKVLAYLTKIDKLIVQSTKP